MSVVEKTVLIDADIDQVWAYLSDRDLLAKWLMKSNFSGKIGEEFEFHGTPVDDWDGVLHCRLLEFDAPNRISFTWDANDIQGETIVTIFLSEKNSQTELRLVHTNFDQAKLDTQQIVDRHEAGWDKQLAFLVETIAEA